MVHIENSTVAYTVCDTLTGMQFEKFKSAIVCVRETERKGFAYCMHMKDKTAKRALQTKLEFCVCGWVVVNERETYLREIFATVVGIGK